jgi:ethanolamine ammonia-lyase small subunit
VHLGAVEAHAAAARRQVPAHQGLSNTGRHVTDEALAFEHKHARSKINVYLETREFERRWTT